MPSIEYSHGCSETAAVMASWCLGVPLDYCPFENDDTESGYEGNGTWNLPMTTASVSYINAYTSIHQIECDRLFEPIVDPTSLKKVFKEIKEKLLSQEESSEDLKHKSKKLIEIFLSSENIDAAREISELASKKFPDEKNFSVAKNILSPPKLLATKRSETEGIAETVKFLRNIDDNFDKKWVAVSRGQLLAVSKSYSNLVEMYKGKDVFITKVL